MPKLLILLTVIFAIPFTQFSQELNQIDDLGRKQGKWRKTYPTGAIRYEGQFNNNKPFGVFKYYYESSVIKAITKFSDDGVIARTRTFHENGKPMAEGKYINQTKDSSWRYFSDVDGVLIAEENYKAGLLNGKSTTYYPDSEQAVEVIFFKDGTKDGNYFKYFPDGRIMLKGTYKKDKLEGTYVVYYPDGKMEAKGDYINGIKSGNWSYFNEDGQQLTEDEYKKEADQQ